MRGIVPLWCVIFALTVSSSYADISAETWFGSDIDGNFAVRTNGIFMKDGLYAKITACGYKPEMVGLTTSAEMRGVFVEYSVFGCDRDVLVGDYSFHQKFFNSVAVKFSRWNFSLGGSYFSSLGDIPEFENTQTEATGRLFLQYDAKIGNLSISPQITYNSGFSSDGGQDWLGGTMEFKFPLKSGSIGAKFEVYSLADRNTGRMFLRGRKIFDISSKLDLPFYMGAFGSNGKILPVVEGVLRFHPLNEIFNYVGLGIHIDVHPKNPKEKKMNLSPVFTANLDKRCQVSISAMKNLVSAEAGVSVYKNIRILLRYEKIYHKKVFFLGMRY